VLSRLDDVLGSETRNAVAKHELIEIIRTTKIAYHCATTRLPTRDGRWNVDHWCRS